MRVPIQMHVGLCISLCSRNFFTHRAVVATSAQCFGIGTSIQFEQLREDCVSALTGRPCYTFIGDWVEGVRYAEIITSRSMGVNSSLCLLGCHGTPVVLTFNIILNMVLHGESEVEIHKFNIRALAIILRNRHRCHALIHIRNCFSTIC